MTSQAIEIHQRSVLQIIKTCFNIYLTSRSKVNEATAQGSLSQMLNGIFSKMEQKMVSIYNLYRIFMNKFIFRLSYKNDENNVKKNQQQHHQILLKMEIYQQVKR